MYGQITKIELIITCALVASLFGVDIIRIASDIVSVILVSSF